MEMSKSKNIIIKFLKLKDAKILEVFLEFIILNISFKQSIIWVFNI